MIKGIFAFLVLSLAIGVLIKSWRELKGMEKWRLTKMVGYSMMCSAIALIVLIGVVILF